MQRKHGAWDAGKRIACAYVSGTWQLLLACRRSGGARSCGFAAGTLRGLAPAGVPLGGTQCAPSPEEDPKALPHDPKKSQRKYGRKNIKKGLCTPAGASIFLTGRFTSSPLPGRSYGYKRPDGLPAPGYIPRAGPASSTSPWYRADSCGVHPPAPEYPAAAQWPDWPRR